MSEEKVDEKPLRTRRPTSAGAVLARRRPHAIEPDDEGVDEEQLKLAGFRVGDGLYGIDIMRIKEVIQATPYPVRPVPHAPDIVEGVIALRGVVIPVVDLRKRFGVASDPSLARLNKLVIVSVRGRIVGLKVDRIIGELRVPSDAVRPAPSLLRPGGRDEFFAGVCRKDDEMVFVVNLETVIDPRTGSAIREDGEREES
jgi:purine-binding chemotaxis protein CheW